MKLIRISIFLIIITVLTSGCTENKETNEAGKIQSVVERESKIPSDIGKASPQTDVYPPKLHSNEFKEPVPMEYPINTAGAEDSPFMMPDGKTFYFFFTPDVRIPPEKQLIDQVTGIYVSKKIDGNWSKPERMVLQEPDKLALDGCLFVQGEKSWFCSAREGYTGINMFTAEFKDGKWQNWKYAGDKLNKEYQIGELHITVDDSELYFHSPRAGGKGQYDIWVTRNINGEWQVPENVETVNSEEADGWPYISQDGKELWFTRIYMGSPAIFRSKRIGQEWQKPELMLSQFAGEPTLDNDGNIYFTHHFYKDNKMIEADIYVAYRK